MTVGERRTSIRNKLVRAGVFLAAAVALGILIPWLTILFLESTVWGKPLIWHPFSKDSLQANLREGRTTLVFFHHDAIVYSAMALREAIDTPGVRRAIRSAAIDTMIANTAENESPHPADTDDALTALVALGHGRGAPTIAIYSNFSITPWWHSPFRTLGFSKHWRSSSQDWA